MFRICASILLLALFLPLACSKPAAPAREACELISKDAAEKVLGVALSEPKSQGFGTNPRQTNISNCLYVAAGAESEIKSLTFMIRLSNPSQPVVDPAETLIRTIRQDFGQDYQLSKISYLGDGAVWDPSLKQLTVFKGSTTYVWTSSGAAAPDLEEKLITLAKSVVK